MSCSRNGKIARLPRATREQLNQRIRDGEKGIALVAWLNTLPEVREVIDRDFGGIPVQKFNLTRWRQGGYVGWLSAEKAGDGSGRILEEGNDLKKLLGVTFTEDLAIWLSARYAIASRKLGEVDDPKNLRLLLEICQGVLELRRCDQSAQRIENECERVDLEAHDPKIRYRLKRNVELDELAKDIQKSPKAMKVYKELMLHLKKPYDPTEPMEPYPPASN